MKYSWLSEKSLSGDRIDIETEINQLRDLGLPLLFLEAILRYRPERLCDLQIGHLATRLRRQGVLSDAWVHTWLHCGLKFPIEVKKTLESLCLEPVNSSPPMRIHCPLAYAESSALIPEHPLGTVVSFDIAERYDSDEASHSLPPQLRPRLHRYPHIFRSSKPNRPRWMLFSSDGNEIHPTHITEDSYSLDLAAFLSYALWCRGACLTEPVAATGEVGDKGRILPVGFVRNKITAIRDEASWIKALLVPAGAELKGITLDWLEVVPIASCEEAWQWLNTNGFVRTIVEHPSPFLTSAPINRSDIRPSLSSPVAGMTASRSLHSIPQRRPTPPPVPTKAILQSRRCNEHREPESPSSFKQVWSSNRINETDREEYRQLVLDGILYGNQSEDSEEASRIFIEMADFTLVTLREPNRAAAMFEHGRKRMFENGHMAPFQDGSEPKFYSSQTLRILVAVCDRQFPGSRSLYRHRLHMIAYFFLEVVGDRLYFANVLFQLATIDSNAQIDDLAAVLLDTSVRRAVLKNWRASCGFTGVVLQIISFYDLEHHRSMLRGARSYEIMLCAGELFDAVGKLPNALECFLLSLSVSPVGPVERSRIRILAKKTGLVAEVIEFYKLYLMSPLLPVLERELRLELAVLYLVNGMVDNARSAILGVTNTTSDTGPQRVIIRSIYNPSPPTGAEAWNLMTESFNDDSNAGS